MDLMLVKFHLPRGRLLRRLLQRISMLVVAVMVVSLIQVTREVRVTEQIALNAEECPFDLGSNPGLNFTGFLNSAASSFELSLFGVSKAAAGGEVENLTRTIFEALMDKNLLQADVTALCVGERSASAVLALRHLGFFKAVGADSHPYFSLFKRRFVYELNYDDNHFDFVFSEDLDRVSVPGLLVQEIERVLRPGGISAILLGSRRIYSGGYLSPAATVASFLENSDVQHACSLGTFNLMIIKRRIGSFPSFEHFRLPAACPAVANNKPLMKHIEPLVDKVSGQSVNEPSYLPNFMNLSSRNRLVYINVGAGEYARTAIAKLSKPYCANHHTAFEVFIIDHKTSVLSSYVTEPGIHFVYHPALAGDVTAAPDVNLDEFMSSPMDEEEFEFVPWFKETVTDGDFVVLMMNSKFVELNILVELFKTGEICHVDELFLKCSDSADCKTGVCGDCANLFKSLRNSGVYAHKWSGD